jgi:outer membrane protein OmpA-like peptidoglycan-associated protein
MGKITCSALVAAALAVAVALPMAAQEDKAGSQDYPLFSRFPGYRIDVYEHRDFDQFTFKSSKDAQETVEGVYYRINYYVKRDAAPASALEVIRNYENTIRKGGGTVLYTQGSDFTFGKIVHEGKEIWVRVRAWNNGQGIELHIVERQAMEQTIEANASTWLSDIAGTGRAAVHGITFDTDKAIIKPESEPVLAEMAKLLRENPSLNVFIVGHTDATGTYEHNLKLSQERAAAVVNALVTGHGIAAARMTSVGVGPVAPVATNDSEDGRAKNRRVELVKL